MPLPTQPRLPNTSVCTFGHAVPNLPIPIAFTRLTAHHPRRIDFATGVVALFWVIAIACSRTSHTSLDGYIAVLSGPDPLPWIPLLERRSSVWFSSCYNLQYPSVKSSSQLICYKTVILSVQRLLKSLLDHRFPSRLRCFNSISWRQQRGHHLRDH